MNDRQRILGQLRQQSLQARAQALNEQARNRQSLTPIVPSGSGGSGCNPASGIGMYIIIDTEGPLGILKSLARMEYQGVDEGGKPTYAATLTSTGANGTLNYDYEVGKWKFALIADATDVYYSDTLISSDWDGTASPGAPAVEFTTCGYPELPVYCIDTGETGLVQPLPTWFESQDENTEAPSIWAGFGLITFIWLPAFIIGGPDGWFLSAGEEEGLIPGGSINELPLGEIPLGEGSVTISAGACDF